MKGTALQGSGLRIRALPSLLTHSEGCERKISAYNTVDASVEYQDGYRIVPCAGYGLEYSGFDL